MSIPAVDGGGRSAPWRPAPVIFLLNKEAGRLTSGGDLGAVRSLGLEHVFAAGDRWSRMVSLKTRDETTRPA